MRANTAVEPTAQQREKRAQAIAAMNLVTREGDRFKVATPSLRGRQTAYEVRRDDSGRVRCTCLEFEESIGDDSAFRCEHILAVKFSLLAKNTEPSVKQPAPLKPVEPQAIEGQTVDQNDKPQTEVVASETAEQERDEESAQKAIAGQIANRQAELRALADTKGENKVRKIKENNATAFQTVEQTEQQQHNEENNEQQATLSNVVPMPFAQTLQVLRQRVEPAAVKQREGWRDRNGNVHMVDYVEWHTVADILDRVAPHWSHTIRDIKQIGEVIAVTAAITVDGVTREGIGTGSADTELGIKKAEHDALKRAAVKFGIARELYRRESDVIETVGTVQNNGGIPSNPIAKSIADLVTPKQLGMIRALARENNVDMDEECNQLMNCKTDELSKRAASAFIQHLQEMQGGEAAKPETNNNNGLRRVS